MTNGLFLAERSEYTNRLFIALTSFTDDLTGQISIRKTRDVSDVLLVLLRVCARVTRALIYDVKKTGKCTQFLPKKQKIAGNNE